MGNCLRKSPPFKDTFFKCSELSCRPSYIFWEFRLIASYVLPVRQASVLLTASFRFHLTMDTLAVRLIVPLIGPIRDFHSLELRHARRTTKKKREISLPLFLTYLASIFRSQSELEHSIHEDISFLDL
jgi:hypothetical protein